MSKSQNSLLAEDAHHPTLKIHFTKMSVHDSNGFNKLSYNKSYNFDKPDLNVLYNLIADTDWRHRNDYYNTRNNVNDLCMSFYKNLYDLFDICVL